MAPVTPVLLVILVVKLYGTDALADLTINNTQTVWVRYGSRVTLDCAALRSSVPSSIFWVWNRKQNRSNVTFLNATTPAYELSNVTGVVNNTQEVDVLTNGSLYIDNVKRTHAGLYYCIVSDEFGNETFVFAIRLNYNIVSIATLNSIIIGLGSASAFFLIAVFIGLTRYLAYVCSSKEKRKRKSIRAVLEAIQDYKSAQIDRFSAYRTAKMDQLSAFKSATIGHLSAFRTARVDQLRTYKQATVTSILAHLDRMRDHYAAQTARIKENCAMQAERLRDSYSSRRGRFKNYRSHQVDRVRENYQAQAARIREYGLQQMSKLREQYKTQQQHVLKLVELLDVGSCVSGVIEAECMRAESMIFDADITFDFEAQPARPAGAGDDGDNCSTDSDMSHYVSACGSRMSINSITADVVGPASENSGRSLGRRRQVVDDSMLDDIDLEDIVTVDLEISKCIASLSETMNRDNETGDACGSAIADGISFGGCEAEEAGMAVGGVPLPLRGSPSVAGRLHMKNLRALERF